MQVTTVHRKQVYLGPGHPDMNQNLINQNQQHLGGAKSSKLGRNRCAECLVICVHATKCKTIADQLLCFPEQVSWRTLQGGQLAAACGQQRPLAQGALHSSSLPYFADIL